MSQNSASTISTDIETEPETVYELAKRFPNYVRDASDFKCQKEIGRGGFGVVWLGDDLRTHQKVAVKEFLSHRLTRRQTTHFIREIYTMAISRSPFIVPLVGFTVEHPFTIITKYEENGQLSKYIKLKTSSTADKLTPTQLTIVSLCIASALVDLNELHIIHRDLKSGNILMDQDLIPKVCDFGTARVLKPGLKLTTKLGTINFMAPELITTTDYNEKVDVYDFGMILYEMNEGHLPHSDKKREELLDDLGDHPIPLEFKQSSKEMKNFIKTLTSFDPEKRPTIEEVYQSIASGKISFPGTKKHRIQKVLKSIAKKSSKKKELPPLYVNIDEVLQKLEERNNEERKEAQEGSAFDTYTENFHDSSNNEDSNKFDFTQLENLDKNENFNEFFEKTKNEVKRSQFPELAASLTKAIQQNLEEEKIIGIYNLIIYFIHQDMDIFIALMKSSFFYSMQLTSNPVKELAIDIFGYLFKYQPKLIKVSLTKPIVALIQFDTESMIIMLSHYIEDLPPQEDSFPVIGIFIDQSESILKSNSGPNFIRIMYKLLSSNSLFKEQYIEQFSPVLMNGCQSSNDELATVSLQALANLLPDEKINVNFEMILQVAGNQALQKHLISVLIRLNDFPQSKRVAFVLFNFAKVSQRGFLSLMNFCSSSDENAKIVASMEKWMTVGLPSFHNTFRLFLLLFSHEDLREVIYKLPSYPQMLRNFVNSSESFIYTCLPSVIRRSNLDDDLLNTLQNGGFWNDFFNKAINSNSKKIISAALVMADTVASVGFIKQFRPFIPKIKETLKNHSELTQQAITVIVRLSYLNEAKEDLNIFVQYFKSLKSYQNYEQYANTFLENLEK